MPLHYLTSIYMYWPSWWFGLCTGVASTLLIVMLGWALAGKTRRAP